MITYPLFLIILLFLLTGTYSTGGTASCTLCTAGYYCTSATQTPCGHGKYSTGGATVCHTCPAGYYCNSSTTATPTNCSAGTYSTAGQGVCQDCPIGNSCPMAGMKTPQVCVNGTYQDTPGQASCLACPAGKNGVEFCFILYNWYFLQAFSFCYFCAPHDSAKITSFKSISCFVSALFECLNALSHIQYCTWCL